LAPRFLYDAVRQTSADVIAPQLQELRGEIVGLRGEMRRLEKRIDDGVASLRSEIASVRNELVQLRKRLDDTNVR
jgi:predicted  nucleic acid-binding Zn-ribbon protein